MVNKTQKNTFSGSILNVYSEKKLAFLGRRREKAEDTKYNYR